MSFHGYISYIVGSYPTVYLSVCPGRHLAEEMVFSLMATTLATFNITPECGPDGKLSIPSGEYTDGGIMYAALYLRTLAFRPDANPNTVIDNLSFPVPFRCSIQPRSTRAKDLILSAWKDIL